MNKIKNFSKGMGIGGWLTNYKRFNTLPNDWRMPITIGDMEHFASYITAWDAENIKNMGLDHVRVGFDQIVMEYYENPYHYREEVFGYLESFVNECEKRDLRVILNMHKAVGNYCDIIEKVSLFESEELQERFIALWVELEKRYSNHSEVMFELLNEVLDIDPELWNSLADRTIKAIREINPDRYIIVGSTCWNKPHKLPFLKVWDDDKIIYTYHMYDPHEFTHQRGVLQSAHHYYNRVMPYPATTPEDMEHYDGFAQLIRNDPSAKAYPNAKAIDYDWICDYLKPAKEFAEKNPDKILWLGEFGTIRHCPIEYRENYMRDVIRFAKENDTPFCVWNYLSTPYDGNRFSLVDDDTRKILSPKLAEIIKGNV